MNKKVLYFEGAGMDFYSDEQTNFSDVGNFRIRTAFKNLEGIEYYIELGNCPRYDKKYKPITNFGLRIDHLFKLEDRHKEEYSLGGYEIKTNHLEVRQLDYTKENITNWINENLNCNFDTIEVLDNFYGYRVHGGYNKDGIYQYNLMEDIDLNHKRATKRKEAYNNIIERYKKLFNRKYPAISIKEMADNYIIFDNHQGDELLKKYNLTSRYDKVLI